MHVAYACMYVCNHMDRYLHTYSTYAPMCCVCTHQCVVYVRTMLGCFLSHLVSSPSPSRNVVRPASSPVQSKPSPVQPTGTLPASRSMNAGQEGSRPPCASYMRVRRVPTHTHTLVRPQTRLSRRCWSTTTNADVVLHHSPACSIYILYISTAAYDM